MHAIFTPEYLGGQKVDLDQMQHPYELGVFLHLTKGKLSVADAVRLHPINTTESALAANAVSICSQTIELALEKVDDTMSNDPQTEGLRVASQILNSDGKPREVFSNSYDTFNRFTYYKNFTYDDGSSERRVIKLPNGLRAFSMRGYDLLSAIERARHTNTDTSIRFETSDALKREFPCMGIDYQYSAFDEDVLDAVYENRDLPVISSAKQASDVISLLGGGTIYDALHKSKDELTDVEMRIRELGSSIMRFIGNPTVLRQTTVGRSIWGAHSIRLRTGDTIPKVTLPKPGV